MIGTIDQSDARVGMAQMLAESKTAKTGPEDNYMPRVFARHRETVCEGGGRVKGPGFGPRRSEPQRVQEGSTV